MLKKLIIIVVVVAVVFAGGLYLYRNMIVKAAIEESGTYVMKVDTELNSAGLELGAGSLELSGYSIANPDGFESDNFLKIEHGMLDIETGSIFDDEFIVDSLILDGITINLEQINSKNNVMQLLDNLKQFDVGESKSEQKISIKKVSIRNINVNGMIKVLNQEPYQKTFNVKDFTLSNLGGDNGASLEEITQKLFKELLSRTAASGQTFLPIDLNQKADELKDEAKDKIETEAKDQLKKIGL